jgi:hypothetical protein
MKVKEKCEVWESYLIVKKLRKFCDFKDGLKRSLKTSDREKLKIVRPNI